MVAQMAQKKAVFQAEGTLSPLRCAGKAAAE